MIKWSKTILYVFISAVAAHWLPFSSFFKNVDTLVHEFGHAMVTLALSGQVMSIELYADHSGVTRSAVANHWTMVPIALAGYMTASLFTWFLFAAYAQGRYKAAVGVTTAVAAAALLLFVRNGSGSGWLLGFILLNVLVLVFAGHRISRFYLLAIAFLSLEESVFGPVWLNFAALLKPEQAGDAAVLSQFTPMPAIVWTIWFTLFAFWCAKRAVGAFAARPNRRAE
jgi:hypothetical protein